jgi:hypothetical protein
MFYIGGNTSGYSWWKLMKIQIVNAKAEHIEHIAANVREADKQEMKDYANMTPLQALEISFYNSKGEAWTGLVDDVPVTMFGVGKPNYIWLVGTTDIHKYDKLFLIKSRKILKKLMEKHPILENYVELKNTRSVQWLAWLGFNMEQPEPMGVNNELFCHFWLEGIR